MLEIHSINFEIDQLKNYYQAGRFTPADIVAEVYRRIRTQVNSGVWVTVVSEQEAIEKAKIVGSKSIDDFPLYGIPFSVKDNIHVEGLPTTASCPAFSHYPKETATVVEKLLAAGAILIGKNTMDQFATGLVGIRSSEHPVNTFNSEYIPGGSSSGSAVAVATGLVSFSLGSDTGGSGRVPAALNNIVGLKPTPGIISSHGMVYANRSFDCVPIFALRCADAKTVFDCLVGFDPKDSFSIRHQIPDLASFVDNEKFTIGIPSKQQLQFFGDESAEKSFFTAVDKMAMLGATIVEIDFSLFIEAGKMIFDGPFLAERFNSLEKFLKTNPHDVNTVVASIVEKANAYSAIDLCQEYYRLKVLQRDAYELFETINAMMVPTAGTIYKIKEVEADPVNLNATMGYYTYYANLLKLSVLAVPAAIRSDGLPFGVCFVAGPERDEAIMELALKWERLVDLPKGALLLNQ
ncbi:MAG: allophanate hydrolase [Cellvibrionaceae bacterium]|jgi:allophanate hydrolase